ncbi:MAG: TetR family transcriptional regulator C-terminal domain-containing protein, partial [Mycolicibacterium aromaticivorans]|nr:TetR family transcriptional regulator C-terminal domain-containing protein [Mycolicibacterium aromaticivorans]
TPSMVLLGGNYYYRRCLASRGNLLETAVDAWYYRDMSQVFIKSGFQTACLTGKFSTEVAATSDVFRPQLADQIEGWKVRLSSVFAAGQERGDVRQDRPAEDLADVVLALIEGSFVLTLSTRDEHTLTAVCDAIRQLIERPN